MMTYNERRKQWACDREEERFLAHIWAVGRLKGEPLDVKYTGRTLERWRAAYRLLYYYNVSENKKSPKSYVRNGIIVHSTGVPIGPIGNDGCPMEEAL